MELSKIHKSKIYEEIAEQLKIQIVSAGLQPGDKLPSAKELMEQFQVGRSTVREALSALQAMGIIETRQGEGSFVRAIPGAEGLQNVLGIVTLDKETTIELLEAREALEVANASLAALKRTEADLQRLDELIAQMEQSLGDEVIGEQLDLAFHVALAEASHNAIMVQLLETISTQIETAIKETRRLQMYANKAVSERLLVEHRDIVEAVRQGDAELSRQKMRVHLYHVKQVLLRFIQ